MKTNEIELVILEAANRRTIGRDDARLSQFDSKAVDHAFRRLLRAKLIYCSCPAARSWFGVRSTAGYRAC